MGDAYAPTLDRIKAQDSHKSRLGTTALMWICHSERQLRAEELCLALAVEIGSTGCDTDDAPSIQTVLSCCQGLIAVDKGSTVRLIHHRLLGYLVSHGSFFQSPHSTIAETCLTYLNSQQVMALSSSGVQSTEHPPFLEYSSLYWGTHMKKEFSDHGKTLALKLFSSYECHMSIRPLLERKVGRSEISSIGDFHKFTGLHFASMFGLVEVATALTKMDGIDINGTDETTSTPLLWAADNGHEAVVKLLLGCEDVNPNRPDKWGRTPIMWAARNGHEATVKLLLGREDVSPDRAADNGETPILLAAKYGHEAVVKLLLGREDVNPNRPNMWDQTPISLASENGHEAVVQLFPGPKDANPDKPDV